MQFIETYKNPLSFIVIVLLGRLLALKVHTVQHIMGFQQVIMSCFLPALLLHSITSLPLSELKTSWQYPVVSLIYSFFLLACMQVILWITRFVKLKEEKATLLLMFPGLAPGLTSMPYVTASVAQMEPKNINGGQVGLADLGIKLFVLFILFILAMQMSKKTEQVALRKSSTRSRHLSRSNYFKVLKNLIYGFLTEPVNFASVLGVVLLSAGPVQLEDMSIAGHAIIKLGKCCAPAIFLIIGMKVKVFQRQQAVLLMLMVLRTGLAFLFTYILGKTVYKEQNEIMFWVFLCNSSLSFWPYTHICKIGDQEDKSVQMVCTGLLNLASNDVALSEEMREIFGRLHDSVKTGDSTVKAAIEEACLFAKSQQARGSTASCDSDVTRLTGRSSSDTLKELIFDLENLLERKNTFNPTLALMSLSISTSWTVLSCTILSLTPVDFWVGEYSLLAVGSALVLVGMLGLGWNGWILHKAEASSSSEDDDEESTPADLRDMDIDPKARRQSLVSQDAAITMLEACEADFVLREQEAETLPTRLSHALGSQKLAGPLRNSVVEYGLRKSMERLDSIGVEDDIFVPFRSSVEMSSCLRESARLSARFSRVSNRHCSMPDRSVELGQQSKVDGKRMSEVIPAVMQSANRQAANANSGENQGLSGEALASPQTLEAVSI